MSQQYEGIHAALLTPFASDDSVNEAVLADLIDDLLDNGVHGLVVNGSTGEGLCLRPEEWRRTAELAREKTRGHVPMTVQVGALTTRQAVENTAYAGELGADAVMLLPPFYEPLDDRELETYVRAVAEVDLPIMIYNNPAAVGWSISPEQLARLSRIDQVQYLKDTTPDAARLFEVRRLIGDRLQLLNGQDSLAIVGFLGGTRAGVWGAANATPRACVRLWELTVDRPDLDAARRLWEALYPVMQFFEASGYVASVKAATELRGIPVGAPRLPSLPLSEESRRQLSELLAAADEVLQHQPALS
jgi:4-hydroxy-tetrahydrodipicolinate synthase